MKKTLLLILLTAGLSQTSIGQIVTQENWDGLGPGIAGWTRYNQDGLAPNTGVSFVSDAWVSTAEEFDNNVAMSTSWYTAPGTSNDWLVSPSITLLAGVNTLYWDARSYDPTYKESYKVFISTTGNAVANFTTQLFVQGNGTSGASGENTTWTRRSIDLSAYAGQTVYIAFQNFSNDMFLMSVDNISVINNATCLAPARGFVSSAATSSSATLGWNPVAGATMYDIAVGTAGFMPTTATYTSNTNSYVIPMAANSRSQAYVRNSCGSSWIGPYSLFSANSLPYAQGFEGLAANGYFLAEGWTNSGWSLGTNASAAQAGVQYAFRNSSTTAATDAWLFTRPLSLSAGEQVTMTFYTRLGAAGTAHSLKIDVANTNNPLDHATPLSSLTISGTTYTLQTVNYTAPSAGTYYFSFHNDTPIVAAATSLRLDTVNLTSVLSTSDFDQSKLSVYPNPAASIINIANEGNLEIKKSSLTDVNGRVVKTVNGNISQINISDLNTGVYFMNIETNEGTAVKKIVKN